MATALGARDVTEARLTKQHPGREAQVRTLLDLFYDADQATPAVVHIHDPESGSTSAQRLVQDVLDCVQGISGVVVDPLTCPSPEHLFARMGAGLTADEPLAVDAHVAEVRSLDQFVDVLQRGPPLRISNLPHDEMAGSHKRIVVVIELAERMRDLWPESLVAGMFDLADLAAMQGRLTVVTLSSLELVHFGVSRGPGSHRVPANAVVINCRRLTKTAVVADLMLHFDHLCTHTAGNRALDLNALHALFVKFASIAYEAFAAEVRGLAELRTLICCVWHPFVQPVLNGTMSANAIQPLLLRAASLFRDALERLHTRQLSPAQWTQEWVHRSQDAQQQGVQAFAPLKSDATTSVSPSASNHTLAPARAHLGDAMTLRREAQALSLLSTFVIISSTLASYNPARLDLQYFVRDESAIYVDKVDGAPRARKKGGALRKGRQQRKKKPYDHSEDGGRAETTLSRQELLGPRPFTLDRLLSVLQALATEVAPDVRIALEATSAKRALSGGGGGGGTARSAGGMAAERSDPRGRPMRDDGWEVLSKGVAVFEALNGLLRTGLLVRTSAADRLDVTTMMRSNVSRDMAVQLGGKVGIEVGQWLCD